MRLFQVTTDPDTGWSDWQQPVLEGYKLGCCHCGLVHNLDFRIHKGKIQFRASANPRSTANARRGKQTKENIKAIASKL